jgi:uncharacterized protein YidB (DUF937 family)
MGLLDILNGMQNGPGGQRQPGGTSGTGGKSSGGGMSPLTMAILGMLAYKALKSFTGGQPAAPGGPGRPTPAPTPLPGGGTTTAGAAGGGGLADILGGLLSGKPAGMPAGGGQPGASLNDLFPKGLGGLLGGAAAGSVLSGGLDQIIKGMQNSGHGNVAQSWVGTGPNKDIAPNDLASALGVDTIDALTKQSGMSRNDLLEGLSQNLPDLIDKLTPHGRLPSADEASRML